jgi:hypothetical protein
LKKPPAMEKEGPLGKRAFPVRATVRWGSMEWIAS